jgi:hypothetical protein
MKKKDKTINCGTRVLIALLIAFLYFLNEITKIPVIVLITVSTILISTFFEIFYPRYFLFDLKSE